MAKVNVKPGDLVYFIEDRQIVNIPIKKVGVQYMYIGIRKRIDIYTMKLDTKISHHRTQYYLTEEEAKKVLARRAEVARLGELAYRLKREVPIDLGKTTEEIRELSEALEKFLGDEEPEE